MLLKFLFEFASDINGIVSFYQAIANKLDEIVPAEWDEIATVDYGKKILNKYLERKK